MAAFDSGIARRVLIALALSVLAHALVLMLVRAKPPAPGRPAPPAIAAWIEPAAKRGATGQAAPERIAVPDPSAADASPLPIDAPPRVAPSSAPPAVDPARAAAAAPAPDDPRPAIEVPALRDPTYYPIGALDRLPSLVGSAELCYPQGATGEVAYLLLIDDTGTVSEATLLEVKPEGLFTAAAVESCRGLKFTPAHKGGRAVRSRVRFVVGPTPPSGTGLP